MKAMDLWRTLLIGGDGGGAAPQPTLISKNITANGSYYAVEDDADGYSSVNVNVATTPLTLMKQYIPENWGREDTTGESGSTRLVLPTAEYVDRNGFYGCGAFSCVDLSYANFTSIAEYAFCGFPGDVVIRREDMVATLFSTNAFDGFYGQIYVPGSLVQAYKTATNWSYVASRINPISGSIYE